MGSTYMKVNGVKGYVKATVHKDWLPVTSWDFATSNASQDIEHNLAGVVKADTISGRMLTDASVPSLIAKMYAGEVIDEIVIEDCMPNDESVVMRRLSMKNARFKRCQTKQEKDLPNEATFEIIFEAVKLEVLAPGEGMQEVAWNSVTKKPQYA